MAGVSSVWAVIPTNGRDVFWEALYAAASQCDGVIVVANNGFEMRDDHHVRVISSDNPSNIHRWWNAGMDVVPHDAHTLVLNDDCILGPNAVQQLSAALDASGAEIAHPHVPDGRERIAGWCWMLRAGSTLRADETFGWWWGDDDLQRRAAGVIAVGGIDVEHRFPNQFTVTRPDLQAQAGHDRETFLHKWGNT